jgi:hypothetical protein
MQDQTIYLASYKGTQKGLPGWMNRGIRWLTRSIYSHTEICIGHPFGSPVHCISSSSVDGGVRAKLMHLNPEKWDVLPMPWVKEEAVWAFVLDHKGSGYDLLGAGRFLLPFLLREHPNKWFCTEVVAAIAGFKEPWRFSPADFHIVVQAQEGLIKQ